MSTQEDDALGWEETLVAQVFQLWVNPELERRGLNLSQDEITQVVVEMPGSGGELKVSLNKDAQIIAVATAKRDIKAGEQVYTDDLGEIKDIHPARADPNSGWICYVRLGDQQWISFDLRYNKEKSSALLQKAREFLTAAIRMVEVSPDVALDNAYSAVELAVQAQMLLAAANTSDHKSRREWFSGWTRLENSPRSHSDLLFNLADQRSRARYESERVILKPGRLSKILSTVQEIIDDTEARIV